MKAELVPLDGGAAIVLVKDLTVVGRNDEADVRLDRRSVSKAHCVLVKTDGFLFVRDLASTNGTKVNGQRVRRAALLPGDQLSIGGEKFHVRLGPDDASTSHVKTDALIQSELEVAEAPQAPEFDEPTPRVRKLTDDGVGLDPLAPAAEFLLPSFDPTSADDDEATVGPGHPKAPSTSSSVLPAPAKSDWPLPPEDENGSSS